MENKRFVIMMRFWNGHGYDVTGKDVKFTKDVSSTVLWILKTLRPYQISITDTKNTDPIPNPDREKFLKGWVDLGTEQKD